MADLQFQNRQPEKEKSLHADERIIITNRRIKVGNTVYPIRHVTSVGVTYTKRRLLYFVTGLLGVIFSILFFLPVVSGSAVNPGLNLVISGIFAALGCPLLWKYFSTPNRYYVKIGISSEGKRILSSKDQDYIQKIVRKINQALVDSD